MSYEFLVSSKISKLIFELNQDSKLFTQNSKL